jgi:hypothetical protein
VPRLRWHAEGKGLQGCSPQQRVRTLLELGALASSQGCGMGGEGHAPLLEEAVVQRVCTRLPRWLSSHERPKGRDLDSRCLFRHVYFLCGEKGHGAFMARDDGSYKCSFHRSFQDECQLLRREHGVGFDDICNEAAPWLRDEQAPVAASAAGAKKTASIAQHSANAGRSAVAGVATPWSPSREPALRLPVQATSGSGRVKRCQEPARLFHQARI